MKSISELSQQQVEYLLSGKYEKEGKGISELATEWGMKKSALYQLRSTYNIITAHPERESQMANAFKLQYNVIKKYREHSLGNGSLATKVVTNGTSNDPFAVFEKAEEAYKGSLLVFIEAMVERKVGEIKTKNEELEKTINRLQRENNEYQETFLKLKNANWVDSLKRHFGN